jgi:hypothetical protein
VSCANVTPSPFDYSSIQELDLPRDPDFAARVRRILDLYDRVWQGRPLSAREVPLEWEHEYFREGAWTHLAAGDVHRADVFGRCEKKTGLLRSIA